MNTPAKLTLAAWHRLPQVFLLIMYMTAKREILNPTMGSSMLALRQDISHPRRRSSHALRYPDLISGTRKTSSRMWVLLSNGAYRKIHLQLLRSQATILLDECILHLMDE